MSTKNKSPKKLEKEKELETQTTDDTKDSSKVEKNTVTVTKVAEVIEPLEVIETKEVEISSGPEVNVHEIIEQFREIKPNKEKEIVVGSPRLTRFEKARIIGARALQLSLGGPSLITPTESGKDSIAIAEEELMGNLLPISLRRILPNVNYQDIPIKWLIGK